MYNNPQIMAKVGVLTPKVVIYKSESHKLHQAFPVKSGETIVQGQPVQLNEDGTIQGYFGKKETPAYYIGVAVTDSLNPAYPAGESGNEVTVMVEGFTIVYGLSNGTIKAGPVIPAELPEDSQYVKYNQGTDESFLALNTASGEGELIQILIK